MNSSVPQIAILLTCFNRKEKTLECLRSLSTQEGINELYSINIFLVDDGSTDGTAKAVEEQFPFVTIIKGTGNLFWNRGMILAWETASKSKKFDFFLLVNDDTILFSYAIKEALSSCTDDNSLVCGSFHPLDDKDGINYGGYSFKDGARISPNGTLQACDFCNANFLLVSYAVYKKLGMLDPRFHHALGDFDYSLRATKKGIVCYITPRFLGACESHHELPKWCSPQVKLKERIKALYISSCNCYPPVYFLFIKRHKGLLAAIRHYFSIHVRVLMPSLWKEAY